METTPKPKKERGVEPAAAHSWQSTGNVETMCSAYGCASLTHGLAPHLAEEIAAGGPGGADLGAVQAAVPPLRQEARSQQVWVEREVKVQTVAAVPQLVENPIRVRRSLGGFPPLYTASVVRQEVGQEVTSGIHSGGVNHFIRGKIPPLCRSHVRTAGLPVSSIRCALEEMCTNKTPEDVAISRIQTATCVVPGLTDLVRVMIPPRCPGPSEVR
ncbi:hypothetical protein EYF80_024898 [Liparis tanakae]|uniref:Uncharacterized protein n=1 Tax=Liparis tanakae TaxID=230148 RepID=A0A4Z2HH93_9TELE|nr:hypothetical protein EYF80_024898 [Liparis tanakae]